MLKMKSAISYKILLAMLFIVSDLHQEVRTSESENKGQPELQQALDNNPMQFPENSLQISLDDEETKHVTDKILLMLSETLRMLDQLKIRERQMVENFIYKLQKMVVLLKKQKVEDKEFQDVSTLPDPTQVSTPAASPPLLLKMSEEFGKYQVTSSQINNVLSDNDKSINRLAVTRPGINLGMPEEDEVVRQLHEQRKLREQELEERRNHATYHTKPLESTGIIFTTSPTTTAEIEYPLTADEKGIKKNMMISNLLKKMDELKHLVGEEAEKNKMTKSSKVNHFNTADFTDPNFVPDQKFNSKEDASKFEIEEDFEDISQKDKTPVVEQEKMLDSMKSQQQNPTLNTQQRHAQKQTALAIRPQYPVSQFVLNSSNTLSSHHPNDSSASPNKIKPPAAKDTSKQTFYPHLKNKSFPHKGSEKSAFEYMPPMNPVNTFSNSSLSITGNPYAFFNLKDTPSIQNTFDHHLKFPNNTFKKTFPGDHDFRHPTLEQVVETYYMNPSSHAKTKNFNKNSQFDMKNPSFSNSYHHYHHEPPFPIQQKETMLARSYDYANIESPPLKKVLSKNHEDQNVDNNKHLALNEVDNPNEKDTQDLSKKFNQNNLQMDDEMEKQLREGKIVVLSDSLVKANFHDQQHSETKVNTATDKQPIDFEGNNDP